MSMVTVYDAIFDALTLRQVIRSDVQMGIKTSPGHYSGGIDPQVMHVISGDPRATFTSADVAGAVAGISMTSGLKCSSAVTIPYNSAANGGEFAGAGLHTAIAGVNGLLCIQSFEAAQDDEVESGSSVSLEFVAYSADGSTAPLSLATGQNLASQAYSASHAMGPVKLGSTQLTGVTNISVKTGYELDVKRYNGLPYPTLVRFKKRRPMIEVTFEDAASLATAGLLFSSITTATAYLRKRAPGGIFVDDAEAAHVKFTLTGGICVTDNASASGQDLAQFKLTMHGLTLAASAVSAIT